MDEDNLPERELVLLPQEFRADNGYCWIVDVAGTFGKGDIVTPFIPGSDNTVVGCIRIGTARSISRLRTTRRLPQTVGPIWQKDR
jgi:hypothetical protein